MALARMNSYVGKGSPARAGSARPSASRYQRPAARAPQRPPIVWGYVDGSGVPASAVDEPGKRAVPIAQRKLGMAPQLGLALPRPRRAWRKVLAGDRLGAPVTQSAAIGVSVPVHAGHDRSGAEAGAPVIHVAEHGRGSFGVCPGGELGAAVPQQIGGGARHEPGVLFQGLAQRREEQLLRRRLHTPAARIGQTGPSWGQPTSARNASSMPGRGLWRGRLECQAGTWGSSPLTFTASSRRLPGRRAASRRPSG